MRVDNTPEKNLKPTLFYVTVVIGIPLILFVVFKNSTGATQSSTPISAASSSSAPATLPKPLHIQTTAEKRIITLKEHELAVQNNKIARLKLEHDRREAKIQKAVAIQQELETAAKAADPIFEVPIGTKPLYRVLKIVPTVKGNPFYIYSADISVPAGLSRSALEANLRHATKMLFEKDQPSSINIFAYKKGSNMLDGVTAGLVNYGIEGGGGLKITLCDEYFQQLRLSLGEKMAQCDPYHNIVDTALGKVRNKFSEAERRRIFIVFLSSEDKADSISMKEYPDIYDQGDLVRVS